MNANALVHLAHQAIRKHNKIKKSLYHLLKHKEIKIEHTQIKEAIKILKKVKHSKRVKKTKIAMKKAINHAKVAIKEAKKIV